jgi:hypothetical protein
LEGEAGVLARHRVGGSGLQAEEIFPEIVRASAVSAD